MPTHIPTGQRQVVELAAARRPVETDLGHPGLEVPGDPRDLRRRYLDSLGQAGTMGGGYANEGLPGTVPSSSGPASGQKKDRGKRSFGCNGIGRALSPCKDLLRGRPRRIAGVVCDAEESRRIGGLCTYGLLVAQIFRDYVPDLLARMLGSVHIGPAGHRVALVGLYGFAVQEP